jgi:hypothetical protein
VLNIKLRSNSFVKGLKNQKQELAKSSKSLTKCLPKKAQADRARASFQKNNRNAQLEGEKKGRIEQIRSLKIPEGLSKEERAKYVEARNKKIDSIKDDIGKRKQNVTDHAAQKREKINANLKSEKTKNREKAASERQKVSSDLKSAVAKARTKFENAKKALDSAYEKTYQKEYDKIASEYSKETSAKSKSTSDDTKTVDTSAAKARLEAERQARIKRSVDKALKNKNK